MFTHWEARHEIGRKAGLKKSRSRSWWSFLQPTPAHFLAEAIANTMDLPERLLPRVARREWSGPSRDRSEVLQRGAMTREVGGLPTESKTWNMDPLKVGTTNDQSTDRAGNPLPLRRVSRSLTNSPGLTRHATHPDILSPPSHLASSQRGTPWNCVLCLYSFAKSASMSS